MQYNISQIESLYLQYTCVHAESNHRKYNTPLLTKQDTRFKPTINSTPQGKNERHTLDRNIVEPKPNVPRIEVSPISLCRSRCRLRVIRGPPRSKYALCRKQIERSCRFKGTRSLAYKVHTNLIYTIAARHLTSALLDTGLHQ